MNCDCRNCDPCALHGFCHLCETESLQARIAELQTSRNLLAAVSLGTLLGLVAAVVGFIIAVSK